MVSEDMAGRGEGSNGPRCRREAVYSSGQDLGWKNWGSPHLTQLGWLLHTWSSQNGPKYSTLNIFL